jgi:hypothetical protein
MNDRVQLGEFAPEGISQHLGKALREGVRHGGGIPEKYDADGIGVELFEGVHSPGDLLDECHDVQADLPQQQPPTPLVAPPTGDAAVASGKTIHVKVRLSDGDLIDAGAFTDNEAAKAHGRMLIQSISAGDSGDWPFLAGRFVRPGMVVSIDLTEEISRY